MSLRIAMLLENNPYPQDVRVRNEAEALVRAGHSVAVVAPLGPDQPRREVVGGVEVERFRLPAPRPGVAGFLLEYAAANLQLYARGLRRLLRGADVVHLHNPPDTLFGVSVAARLAGRRAVYDHHDLFPELFEDKFGPSATTRLLRLLQRASVRTADLVLATNESQREVVAALGGPRGPAVETVRNGPRAAALAAAPARDGALDDPHVVYLGSLATQDGVDQLPGLMRALAERHGLPGARLTVVGDGERRAALEEAFAAGGMAERVRFTGWVAHERVPGLVAEADVCVDTADCSPLNHRSTMIKVAEYMAAARPVVAYELLETTRTAGPAALYAPCGEHGELAALVARLAADPALRNNLASRARERAAELTWERSEERLLSAYAAL